MYCPNCAAPIDGVKFCRSCGSNVSMVPQSMSGQFPQSQASEGELHFEVDRHQKRKAPSIEEVLTELFVGIGFVVAAISILALTPAGVFWWWSLLIPAFALIGRGVGGYLRWKEHQRKQTLLERSGNQPIDYPIPRAPDQAAPISAPTTSELVKPSSVTEHTTRHLQ